eukprot:CAMPEP_0174829236 /NCGR_PEP_ID=MMETSP1114-20130205/1819_1 /TAXON_ID=312471 /ORGANISM="Neobodo designis, Strain CCAP 1951/1" /LENGTH=87 /DNA_ID=CAMNT_0016062981 /DNA_START=85 /DNA_END=344 /DNA_ORIENTATION=+
MSSAHNTLTVSVGSMRSSKRMSASAATAHSASVNGVVSPRKTSGPPPNQPLRTPRGDKPNASTLDARRKSAVVFGVIDDSGAADAAG